MKTVVITIIQIAGILTKSYYAIIKLELISTINPTISVII